MTKSTTINWPKELLEETQKAAKATGQSFQSYVLQGVLERIQRQKLKKRKQAKSSQLSPDPTDSPSWRQEQFVRNRVWIEHNIQTLQETYPDQWIIVHKQQVIGADHKMGKAIDQAEQIVEDVFHSASLMDFVEVTRRVY